MLQTVLHVGQAIGEHTTRQQRAEDRASWIDLVLLEPAQIKHRVVGDPGALRLKELLQLNPVIGLKLEAIENDRRLAERAELEQPHPTECRLEPSRLHVKCNSSRPLQSGEVLDAKKDFHAW